VISLHWEERPEELRRPALVFAFRGWNDAGDAATTALALVAESLGGRRVAAIDPEELFDFQAVRPTIDLAEPGSQRLSWPEIELVAARAPGAERDLLLLAGSEPSYRWRTFCEVVLDAAAEIGVGLLVGLGALLADVPHTRPVALTGIASPPGLVEGMDFRAPSYRGPTGIVGVLHAAAAARGIDAVSLWAPVPHYLAATPNPTGALALVRSLERVTGVAVDAGALEDAAAEHERQVNAAVEQDPAAKALVERLQQAFDEEGPAFDPGRLPSGDALASEFERFLRQRGTNPEG
jgi:proteasome assembly chaperone (PAC2) family protein